MNCDFIYKNHVLHVHLRPEKRSLTMLSDLSRTPTSNPSVTKVTQLTHYFCLAPPSTTSQPLPSFLRMTPDCRSLFLNSYISDPQTKRSSNVPKMSSHQNSEAQIHYSRTSLYDQNNIRIRSFSHLRLCGHEEIWKNVGNIKKQNSAGVHIYQLSLQPSVDKISFILECWFKTNKINLLPELTFFFL